MMQASQIPGSDILDIVFDGRNKDYGAYPLRKFYPGRLGLSMGIVLFSCTAFMLIAALKNGRKASIPLVEKVDTITLIKPAVAKPKPIVPVLQKIKPAQVQYTNPLIVKNELFTRDTLPVIDAVQSAVISNMTNPGHPSDGDAPFPPEPQKSIETVSPVNPVPVIFEHPEIAAHFPGGKDAWRRYLERNLVYPENAQENEIQGTIKLQFIVDAEGNISDVTALNNLGGGLAEEAARIISHGPKWIPAEQHGEKVISRHIQTVTFRLN
jgi:protein TonB